MKDVNEAALEQDEGFKHTLLSTGLRPLMEDTAHDTWGSLGRGQNKLGELYEQLRSNLRMNDPDSTQDFQERLNQLRNGPTVNMDQIPVISAQQIQQDVPKIGLLFGDSFAQGVHPRVDNCVFRSVPIPGGKVCPDSSHPEKKPLSQHLTLAMCGDEAYVGLMCGTNDAANSDPALFRQHYTELVQVAGSKGARVICSSIYHRADRTSADQVLRLNTQIDVLNQSIKEVARNEGAVYLDNCAEVGSSAEYPNTNILTRPKYGHQYLHLRDVAKRDLASRIGQAIESSQERRFPIQRSPQESRTRTLQSSRNPEALPWVSQSARREHLSNELEEARRWFQMNSSYPQRSWSNVRR